VTGSFASAMNYAPYGKSVAVDIAINTRKKEKRIKSD
jgi:hypothetical protein